jgi:hypothetical protein
MLSDSSFTFCPEVITDGLKKSEGNKLFLIYRLLISISSYFKIKIGYDNAVMSTVFFFSYFSFFLFFLFSYFLIFLILIIHSVRQTLRGRKVALQSIERVLILANFLSWIGKRKK